MPDAKCADCKFYQDLGEGKLGECRRYPPVRRMDESAQSTRSQFPSTKPKAWCGEFLPGRSGGHAFY